MLQEFFIVSSEQICFKIIFKHINSAGQLTVVRQIIPPCWTSYTEWMTSKRFTFYKGNNQSMYITCWSYIQFLK